MTMQFLPWVRRGLAAELDHADDGGNLPVHATFPVTVTVNAADASTDVRAYGPGDITGLDTGTISRTAPLRFATNVAPDEFAAVEFEVPDLPWMFTPAVAGTQQRLRPWLVLVVVERATGIRVGVDGTRPLPVLTIEAPAVPADELPDLTQSWAWAHTQVLSASPSADPVAALDAGADTVLSRIICPRRLKPGRSYFAALVPAFDAGVRAGLGSPPDDAATTLGPAWDHGALGGQITLPVYYHWEFTTGPAGDFESLARQLRPMSVPDGVGESPMYIGAAHPALPSLAADAGGIVAMEGALRAPESGAGTNLDARHRALVDGLVDLVDGAIAAAAVGTTGDAEAVAPPIYGQWHVNQHQIPTRNARPRWLRGLNADPRHRTAAGLGAEVVRANQEEYVNVAWQQVGDVLAANRLLELSRALAAVAERIHTRHIATIDDIRLFALTDRAAGRLLIGELTLERQLIGSVAVDGVTTRPFRRLASPVGRVLRQAERRIDTLDATGIASLDGLSGALDGRLRATLSVTPDGIAASELPDLRVALALDSATLARFDELAVDVKARADELVATPATPLRPAQLGQRGLLTDEHLVGVRLAVGTQPNLSSAVNELRELSAGSVGSVEVLGAVAIDGSFVPVTATGDGRITVTVGNTPIRLNEVVTAAATLPVNTGRVVVGGRASGRFGAVNQPPVPGRTPSGRGRPGSRVPPVIISTSPRVDVRGGGVGPALPRVPTGSLRSIDRIGELSEVLTASTIDRDAIGTALAAGGRRRAADDTEIGVSLPPPLRDRAVVSSFVEAVGVRVVPIETIRAALDTLPQPIPFDAPSQRDQIIATMQPRPMIETRLEQRINVVGGLVAGVAPGRLTVFQHDKVAPIMVGPVLDRPLYFDLARYDQNRFLPGAGDIPDNAITLLETNPRFIESFMVGANHEFNRELLWRRYPTDRRSTAFRRFWDRIDDADDITPIHTWPSRGRLGGMSAGDADGSIVLLIRGQLLRRYPNTVVYASTATSDRRIDPAASLQMPIFAGLLSPDIVFVGFDFDVDAATAGNGTMFVLQEQPTEPRFGLDIPVGRVATGAPPSWSDLDWGDVGVEPGGFLSVDAFGANVTRPLAEDVPAVRATFGSHAGDLAAITFQRPFRAAVHSSEVLA